MADARVARDDGLLGARDLLVEIELDDRAGSRDRLLGAASAMVHCRFHHRRSNASESVSRRSVAGSASKRRQRLHAHQRPDRGATG